MHKAGTLGLSCGCSEVFDRPHAGWSLGPHGDWVPMATAPPDRSRSCLSFPGWTWKPAQETAESLADHSAHLPTHGSVRRRSTQVCEFPPPQPPQSRCQPCRGPCLGLRGQTHCHIHPSICETISLVRGPTAEVPISLPAVSREPRSAFEGHPHAWVPGPPVSHGIDDAASPPPALSPRLPPVWPAGENALILKVWWERGQGGQMRPTGVLSLLSPNVTSSQAPSTLRAVAVCKQHWGRFRSHAHRPALAT